MLEFDISKMAYWDDGFSVTADTSRGIYRNAWIGMESTQSALTFQTLKVEKVQ